MTSAEVTRVAIVEDDIRYRQSLETWLQYTEAFTPAASFGSAEALYRRLAEIGEEGAGSGAPGVHGEGARTPWDLVLMDVELPGHDGIEATRRLKEVYPEVPVVMLTMFEDPALIVHAIRVGADGYLLKKAGTDDMLAALHSIVEGGAALTPAVARHVLEQVRQPGPARSGQSTADVAGPSLTDRERDVLVCLVEGLTYAEAADRLGIAFETVRTHVRHVYRKLQVRNAKEAVRRAVRERLI